MSQNLPIPPARNDWWTRFSADPRSAPTTRASDDDRDIAAQAINQAFSDGRLDADEHADRLNRALQTRQVGDLVPLLADITPASNGASAPANVAASGGTHMPVRSTAIRSWVAMAALFNVIWLLTVLTAGHLYYYWPMWPMLGTAIPLFAVWANGGAIDRAREQRRDGRRQRRALR